MEKRILITITVILMLMADPMTGKEETGKAINSGVLQTVSQVDLDRYVGLWYEIAKIPNRFQKKCVRDTTAEYKKRPDGRIEVINRCMDSGGKVVEARGMAKVVDLKSNSKLKVSFVRALGIQLFWGDYWIIGLQKDYRYAVVGDSQRKYGWILCRQNSLTDGEWNEIQDILVQKGYNPNRFVNTTHFTK